MSQPRTPQVSRRQFTAGDPGAIPVQNSLQVSPQIFNTPLWQIGAVYSQMFPLTIGAVSAGAILTLLPKVNLGTNSGFSTFTLKKTQTATIVISLCMAPPVSGSIPNNLLFGTPAVGLTFSSGVATAANGLNFTVQGPGTFSNPILTITLPVLASTTYGGGVTMNLNVQAMLLGVTV